MTVLHTIVISTIAAAVVSAGALVSYDRFVRVPRTPRLAIVDIARLYSAVDQSLKDRVLHRSAEGAGGLERRPLSDAGGVRRPEDFGPALQATLEGLSAECRCAIVAMATVVGADVTIPDFTLEAARRLGVNLSGAPR